MLAILSIEEHLQVGMRPFNEKSGLIARSLLIAGMSRYEARC